MVVKTKFTKKNLIEILSNYSLGNFIDLKPIAKGSVETNYILKTTKGKFIFRYYDEHRSKESVLFEVNLIKYLRNKDYPCPDIFENRRGKFIGIYNNKPYIIFEFVEGKHIKNPNKSQKHQLIEKVAELHNVTKYYNPINKKYRLNYSIETCRKLARKESKKINSISSKEKLKWYERELSKLDLPMCLPKGICHCDFHFSNILFKNGNFNALIDFDDANYTYTTFDLICLIEPFISSFTWNTWNKFKPTDNIFNLKKAKEIVSE